MHTARYAVELFSWALFLALLYVYYSGVPDRSSFLFLSVAVVTVILIVGGPILLRRLPDQSAVHAPLAARVVQCGRLPMQVLGIVFLMLAAFGCTSPHDSDSNGESGAEKSAADSPAMSMSNELETVRFAIKAASCGELAFSFDTQLSRELANASFEAYIRYFESLQARLSPGGQPASSNDLLFGEPRENAAAALGRQLGVTDARLVQAVRDEGGGDVITAAKKKFADEGCPDL